MYFLKWRNKRQNSLLVCTALILLQTNVYAGRTNCLGKDAAGCDRENAILQAQYSIFNPIRRRHISKFAPLVNHSPATMDEVELVALLIQEHGKKWQRIAVSLNEISAEGHGRRTRNWVKHLYYTRIKSDNGPMAEDMADEDQMADDESGNQDSSDIAERLQELVLKELLDIDNCKAFQDIVFKE